jgi:uncharacterized protein YbaP (TraB family)
MKMIGYFPLILFLLEGCVSGKINSRSPDSNKENALLWEISGKEISSPSYIFGTIHMICPEDFIISDTVRKIFSSTEKLYLELDMDDPMMTVKSMKLSLKTDGSLKDMMEKEDYERLEKFMKDSIGLPMLLMNRMKPFALMSLIYDRILPCKKKESYELSFLEMAQKEKKEVLGLERIEDQFDVFDKIPDSSEIRMIMNMVDDLESQKREFEEMVSLYKKKDLSSLALLINKSTSQSDYEDILIYNRNRNWVPVMEKAMSDHSVFFAVGAGHLPSENGVIRLLRKAGYTVRPVE